ncbi:acyltransferase family protein [Sinomonas flava]|uniref:acyltransferase family protein n=1 Tax=Sinomonas flava TaxID=496857 RepID=UPI0039A598D6
MAEAADLGRTRTDGGAARLVYLDVLRVLIVGMVIVHHAAQAYGPTGGFWPVTDAATSDLFRPFYTVNAAVGLGLLFLIAGFFTPRSCDRKGARRFLRERWVRIGIPLAFFIVAVNVPLVWLALGRPSLGALVASLYDDAWQGAYLHLWFLGHLLLYTLVYVAVARVSAVGRLRRRTPLPPPGHGAILAFVGGLVLVTWVIRWWFSVDDWIPLFFAVPAEPANMAQYMSLFVLGVLAYRNSWFERIPRSVGVVWLCIALAAAAAVFSFQVLGLWTTVTATGGPDWRSALRVTLEILICAGLSVGLVVVLREALRRERPFMAAMARASYAAYILHVYIVVGLQVAILQPAWPAGVKFLLVAVFGLLFSFGAAHLSGKVPGLRVLLGTAPRPRQQA